MKEDAHHTSVGLAVETSVFVVLMGAWMWGILALGAAITAPTYEAAPPVWNAGRFAAIELASGVARWTVDPVPNATWHGTLSSPAIAGETVIAELGVEPALAGTSQ